MLRTAMTGRIKMKSLLRLSILFYASMQWLGIHPVAVLAAESGCIASAEIWIEQLEDRAHDDVFLSHTRWNCEFSGHWVRESAEVTNQSSRERMCNDLVLIWTHKKCNYFRDLINPAAYEPCKAWSREMFQRCMANDVEWFP